MRIESVAVVGGEAIEHVVERAVVDEHDLEPVGRPVGCEQRVEAVDGQLPPSKLITTTRTSGAESVMERR